MGDILIINSTIQVMHVCVTDDQGTIDFFPIISTYNQTFERDSAQMCFVLREDTGGTETFVVLPGHTYIIG
ncbi:hypothetical protein K503DRAFT_767452 [Rhizopogon vinicolor AM-OR11-026]|uniref:Uncharacterized protein n=1 Tax=Rhizopogon vinicolor AM-OR11-026 TaxID=1314800 RepID=A0A1B7N9W3_9AGAM|nr:hypothetical protein K503DRAFT_767452 [Rhizopogon vinicolor AM-OR11-026]